ncbi:uncharacterized protein ATNIH1004_011733 [Aspergillus tanneri]|nr:uncharacterized protein ATNIH1004_011733 [Aspergillus tanneri]KAA8641597.1 hypothetical protein ATNIH1004_011733 [Aspergillus tanneri]
MDSIIGAQENQSAPKKGSKRQPPNGGQVTLRDASYQAHNQSPPTVSPVRKPADKYLEPAGTHSSIEPHESGTKKGQLPTGKGTRKGGPPRGALTRTKDTSPPNSRGGYQGEAHEGLSRSLLRVFISILKTEGKRPDGHSNTIHKYILVVLPKVLSKCKTKKEESEQMQKFIAEKLPEDRSSNQLSQIRDDKSVQEVLQCCISMIDELATTEKNWYIRNSCVVIGKWLNKL